MRNITQDEKNLIDRWVREGKVRDIRLMGLNEMFEMATGKPLPPPLDSFPEPIPHLNSFIEYMSEIGSPIPDRTVSVDERGKANRDFKKDDPVVREDTIVQIRRVIQNLPVNDQCSMLSTMAFNHSCEALAGLMISAWAKGYLTQMVEDHERRGQ